jgi:hypothetical protein
MRLFEPSGLQHAWSLRLGPALFQSIATLGVAIASASGMRIEIEHFVPAYNSLDGMIDGWRWLLHNHCLSNYIWRLYDRLAIRTR